MATTVALDDKLQMSLDSLIKLQSKAKTAKAGAAPKAKTGSTAKVRAHWRCLITCPRREAPRAVLFLLVWMVAGVLPCTRLGRASANSG